MSSRQATSQAKPLVGNAQSHNYAGGQGVSGFGQHSTVDGVAVQSLLPRCGLLGCRFDSKQPIV